MEISKKRTIKYLFNEKHRNYIRNCNLHEYNIAEGSIRSGKTVDHIYDFAYQIKKSRDKLFLVTAPTVAQAKLVVGDSNGYGLEHIFRGQSRLGKYRQNEALIIKGADTGYKEKIVIFAGGAKSDSFKSIRGNSYGMWLATEINLHHENTIKEAFNRTAAAKDRKIYWDLNPDNPKHFIYEKHIDKYIELGKQGVLSVNYGHFTINDNPTITQDRLNTIKAQYDKNTVWYKRDIDGLRVTADGLVYPLIANNKDKYILNKIPMLNEINIGVDFGGNESKHSFTATGLFGGYKQLIVLDAETHEPDTPKTLSEQFYKFVLKILRQYGFITSIYADSAEQVLLKGLTQTLISNDINIKVKNSLKRPIIDRIRIVNSLLASQRIYFTDEATTTVEALQEAVWDSKKTNSTERLDDGTTDIDSLDSFEYSFEKHIRKLTMI